MAQLQGGVRAGKVAKLLFEKMGWKIHGVKINVVITRKSLDMYISTLNYIDTTTTAAAETTTTTTKTIAAAAISSTLRRRPSPP